MKLDKRYNSVTGAGVIVKTPEFSHSYNNLDFYLVVLENPRSRSSLMDYFYICIDEYLLEDYQDKLVLGNIIEYSGSLLSTKIDWTTNDISALVEEMTVHTPDEFGSDTRLLNHTIVVSGEVRRIIDPVINKAGQIYARGIIVRVPITGTTYVNIKLTGYGRLISSIDKLELGQLVYAKALAQSYLIKNKYAKRDYLHDNKLIAISQAEYDFD